MIELEKAKSNLEELGLLNAAVFIDAILERAQHANATYIEFLNDLLEAELSERQRRNIEVRSKLARLPYRKTLKEFDFTFQPSIDEKLIRELATMAFVYRAENRNISWPTRSREDTPCSRSCNRSPVAGYVSILYEPFAAN